MVVKNRDFIFEKNRCLAKGSVFDTPFIFECDAKLILKLGCCSPQNDHKWNWYNIQCGIHCDGQMPTHNVVWVTYIQSGNYSECTHICYKKWPKYDILISKRRSISQKPVISDYTSFVWYDLFPFILFDAWSKVKLIPYHPKTP